MLRRLALTKVYTQSVRLRVFLVSVTVLVVPLFIYFSFHVSGRSQYFKDRNFRQLNNFSRQISDRIDNLGTAFTNSVDKFVREPDVRDTQQQSKDCLPPYRSKECFQDYLDVLKTDGAYFTATTVDPWSPIVKEDTNLELKLSIYLAREGVPWLYFDCVGLGGKIHFVAKTNFAQLIRPLINKRGEQWSSKNEIAEEFDHIIIARVDNSKVLFESANDNLTLTALDNITLADSPDKTLDLKARSKTTDSVDVILAGARYKLYAQPIEVPLRTKDSESAETQWVICGLVDATRFRNQTWAISHTVLIVSAFFAGLLLLSWPFLKLVFMGPKDRLRVTEAIMLGVSVVIAGSLLTFFFLFGLTYKQLERTFDRQLLSLASDFQEKFKDELGKALEQINRLEEKRKHLSEQNARHPSSSPARTRSSEGDKTNLLNEICPEGTCLKEKPLSVFQNDLLD